MRSIAVAALSLGATLSLGAALAQNAPDHTMNTGVGPVCLTPHQIDHTKTVDPSTILFYMKNGTIWKNTLKERCPMLMYHGFSYVSHVDEVCGNSQAISVIQSGETCTLGPFTPYTAPATQSP
ncbi:MAG: hypothetical protein ABSA49_16365 [Rhizomicrobium sp.]|jgi:hypothetical protein